MSNRHEWKGSATELLIELNCLADTMKINTNSRSWPKAPNKLSRRLNEARTNLREIGILIDWLPDSSNTRIIIIRKVSPVSSLSLEDPNQTQLSLNDTGATTGVSKPGANVSPKDNDQNYTRNSNSGYTGDNDDTLGISGQADNMFYECYYCNAFKSNNKEQYEKHVVSNHPHKLCYPSGLDLDGMDIPRKGKDWE